MRLQNIIDWVEKEGSYRSATPLTKEEKKALKRRGYSVTNTKVILQ